MTVDPERADDILDRLEDMPNVAGVVRLDQVIKQFREQSAANMWVMTLIFIIATTAIVVGIVYNNARVTLSSKERDLASMRVLGYTRAEISAVLLGELAVHVLLAIPLGLVLGVWMCGWIASQNDPEAFRLPIILSARSYALSAAVTLLAATASAILVRRKIDRFDLTAVLKSRE
jgi:putative ABC transport system permease protein